jgi:hypothetical protein
MSFRSWELVFKICWDKRLLQKPVDFASLNPEDSSLNETFNEADDEVSFGETSDHELLEALENMVLRASKGLSEI